MLLFTGFYLNVNSIPKYLIWLYWTSLFHYAFEALVINELQNVPFHCLPSEFVGGVCPITNGNKIISNLGYTTSLSNIWIDVAFILTIFVVVRVGAYFSLRYLKKPK